MFIDRTYFIGELNIPDNEATNSLLDLYIEKYEKEFLQRLLGITVYNDLVTAYSSTPYDQKWIDLIEGKTYSYYGTDYSYFGIAPGFQGTAFFRESPIANFIYYWFMRGTETQTTSGGEVKTKNENSINTGAGMKVTKAWNEMSKWECDFRQYINAYQTTYNLPYSWNYYFRKINEFDI